MYSSGKPIPCMLFIYMWQERLFRKSVTRIRNRLSLGHCRTLLDKFAHYFLTYLRSQAFPSSMQFLMAHYMQRWTILQAIKNWSWERGSLVPRPQPHGGGR